jgi:mannose-6-phosphate isomerase-like protein (cupin superfamily)
VLSDHPSLHATWSRFGPGRDGADLHVHRGHTDLFYVLSGELTMRLGLKDRQVQVPAGQLVRIPPMVVHGFRNASQADVAYLNLHAPGMEFAEFMRANRDGREYSYDQFDPPEDGIRPASEAVIGEPVADVAEIGLREGVDAVAEPARGQVLSVYVLEGAAKGTWLQARPGAELQVSGGARYLRITTPESGGTSSSAS